MTESTNGLQTEILDAIAKNLPQQMAGVLKSELEDLPRLRKSVARLESSKEILTNDNAELKKQVNALSEAAGAVAAKNEQLKLKEKELRDREYAIDLTLAQQRASHAESTLHRFENLMGIVFRNHGVRSMVTTNNMTRDVYGNITSDETNTVTTDTTPMDVDDSGTQLV